MDSLQSIKHNKNLLRVALEIAGKGNKEGNNEVDEIEEMQPTKQEDSVSEDKTPVELFTEIVMKQLTILEEELEEELEDENLDHAIKTIINKLVDNS